MVVFGAIYATVGFFSLIMFILKVVFKEFVNDILPINIYQRTKLNKFGVFVLSLLIIITVPVYYFLCVGYWLCHVGRK